MDPRDELLSIVAALKTHLAWQEDLGSTGLPRDLQLKEKLAKNPLPEFSQRRERPDDDVRPQHPFGNLPVSPQERTTPRQGRSDAVVGTEETGALRTSTSALPPEALPAKQPDFGEAPRARASHLVTAHPAPLPERVSLATLGSTLVELDSQVKSCTACPLHETRTQTVFSRGTGTSGVCFVGEGPGADEDAQGEPFVGAAGQLLDKMIEAMGLSRDEVYVCNIVKCRPPNNRRPTPVETESCSPYLRRQLELLEPRVIVALGGTAVTGLLGLTEGITRLRGRFRLYEGRIPVMPTFHPAYLLRNPGAKREVWNDLRQVLTHLGRPLPGKS